MGTSLLGFVFYVLMHPAFPGASSKRSPRFCLDLLVMHGSWCGLIRQEAETGGPTLRLSRIHQGSIESRI
jgi:hypothetical protein